MPALPHSRSQPETKVMASFERKSCLSSATGYSGIDKKNPVESISLLSTLPGNVPSLGGIQVLEICFDL